MPLDASSLLQCSTGDKEIPGDRGTVGSCWIGVAALQGLLECWVLSCPGGEGEHQMIYMSKPSPVYSALQSALVECEKHVVLMRGKKDLEGKLYVGMDAASGLGVSSVSW